MRQSKGLQVQMAQAGKPAVAASTRGDCASAQRCGWYHMSRRSGARASVTEPSV